MVTRRQLLKAGGATAALGVVAGCTGAATEGGGAEAAGGSGAAGADAATPGGGGLPRSIDQLPQLEYAAPGSGNGLNVIVIVVDTLRRDHVAVFGGDTITPSIDALAADGLRFPRFHPEAMPTIPVRRTVHSGMRTFPASDWQPVKGKRPRCCRAGSASPTHNRPWPRSSATLGTTRRSWPTRRTCSRRT